MKNKEKLAVGRTPHVLDEIIIPDELLSWEESVGQWHLPMSFDERLAWLNTNHIRRGNGPEQFIFFLELADRYGDRNLFDSLPGQNKSQRTLNSYESLAKMKRRLSNRAFAILCNVFFAKREDPEYPYILPYEDPLFSKLLWFFRSDGEYIGFNNLRPNNTDELGKDGGRHYITCAQEFAKNFAGDAWQMLNRCRYYCHEGPRPKPELAMAHSKEVIDLLLQLDLLDLIEIDQYAPTEEVFQIMLKLRLERSGVQFDVDGLKSDLYVCELLEPLVMAGDKFAKRLYVARLNVGKNENPVSENYRL